MSLAAGRLHLQLYSINWCGRTYNSKQWNMTVHSDWGAAMKVVPTPVDDHAIHCCMQEAKMIHVEMMASHVI